MQSNTASTFNIRDLSNVLQFCFRHGIKIEQAGTDTWRIRSTTSPNMVENLDLTRTYPSFDEAVSVIATAVRGRTSAAA